MILAVADYADDDTRPLPPELQLGLDCERWGSLPETGGIRNQYAGEFLRMKAAVNVYHTMKHFNRALEQHRHAEWMAANPQGAQIVRDVMKMQHERDKTNGRP